MTQKNAHLIYFAAEASNHAGRFTWNKVHAEEPQILGPTVKNLVAWADLCTPVLEGISSCPDYIQAFFMLVFLFRY